MRDAIIHVLQAVHEIIEPQPSHTFELFGADFMVTQDFKTWLIEVNSSPSMAYSTPITKKLCRAVLEDTLKGESHMYVYVHTYVRSASGLLLCSVSLSLTAVA